jgi:hypothetical protein
MLVARVVLKEEEELLPSQASRWRSQSQQDAVIARLRRGVHNYHRNAVTTAGPAETNATTNTTRACRGRGPWQPQERGRVLQIVETTLVACQSGVSTS